MTTHEYLKNQRQEIIARFAQRELANGRAFERAFTVVRSYAGMAALKLEYHPYRCVWLAEGNCSDGTRYQAANDDAGVALRAVAQMVRRNPPRTHK